MIVVQGVFYVIVVIYILLYDWFNFVVVFNEYLVEYNLIEQVDSEVDLVIKVIIDLVFGKSMNVEDVVKLVIGEMQCQFDSFCNDIFQKINVGERVFICFNFISGGVFVCSNFINGI